MFPVALHFDYCLVTAEDLSVVFHGMMAGHKVRLALLLANFLPAENTASVGLHVPGIPYFSYFSYFEPVKNLQFCMEIGMKNLPLLLPSCHN